MKILWTMSFLALGAVCVSGITMLSASHQQTLLVNEVQIMKREYDRLNAEWTNIKLEQRLLGNNQKISRDIQAVMTSPTPENVVYLKR